MMSAVTLTRYEKELARMVAERYGKLSAPRLFEELCRIGVIDHNLCRILAVRRWVDAKVAEGYGKVRAMWLAAEHFCVSYECIRKSVYHYKEFTLK